MLSDPLLLKRSSMKSGQWVPLETVAPPMFGKDAHERDIHHSEGGE
jgi:hypothetical protein